MRRNILLYLTTTALFSSCAYQGVVVEKRFRPVPFSASLGVDAMYNFQLRDNGGQTNSQMVTPDVFATYRVGDYFNDVQAPPAHEDKELEGFRLAPPELRDGPYTPVRVMQMQSPQRGAAKVALDAPGQTSGDLKILRWQTVRILPIQSTQKATAVASRALAQTNGDVKILRWQTVRIAPIQLPEKVAANVAVHAPARTNGDVKILRWQTVRIAPIQLPEKVAVKVSTPSHRRAKSVVKTASSHARDRHSAKIADLTKKSVKVASKSHHKTVASVN